MLSRRSLLVSLILFTLFVLNLIPLGANDYSPSPALASVVADLELARFQQAETALLQLLDREPNNPEFNNYLGRIYLSLDRGQEAVEYFERSVELDPTRADYHLFLSYGYGLKMLRANIFEAMGMVGDFRNASETAVELDPNYIDARFAVMMFHINAPAIAGGSKDEARRQAQAIMGLDEAQGHRAMGMYYEAEERWDEARMAYATASELEPEDIRHHIALAEVLIVQGRASVAFRNLLALTRKPDANNLVWYHLARLATETETRIDLAEGWMESYLNAEPRPNQIALAADVTFTRGRIAELKGQRALASLFYQDTLDIAENYEPAIDGLNRVK